MQFLCEWCIWMKKIKLAKGVIWKHYFSLVRTAWAKSKTGFHNLQTPLILILDLILCELLRLANRRGSRGSQYFSPPPPMHGLQNWQKCCSIRHMLEYSKNVNVTSNLNWQDPQDGIYINKMVWLLMSNSVRMEKQPFLETTLVITCNFVVVFYFVALNTAAFYYTYTFP